MLDGVYGGYIRLYADPAAQLQDVRLDGGVVGPEQAGIEAGRMAFGRFMRVLPGKESALEFRYTTPSLLQERHGRLSYSLVVQKQAGTAAVPLVLRLFLPPGATDVEVLLDNKPWEEGTTIRTDLRVDRQIEVSFRPGESLQASGPKR
jgi:hypothetical protein